MPERDESIPQDQPTQEGQEPQQEPQQEPTQEPTTQPDFSSLAKEIGELKQAMQGFLQLFGGIPQQPTQEFPPYGTSEPEPRKEEEKEPELDEEKLESLSNKELVELVLGMAEERVTKRLEERLGRLEETIVRTELRRQIDETAKKYPDFWNYKDEMYALSQQNPFLTPEQLYWLAKTQKLGPQALQPQQPTQQQTQQPQRRSVPFGGEKPGISTNVKEEKKYGSFKDAASEAWDEIFGPE